jgi:hypothetical protein
MRSDAALNPLSLSYSSDFLEMRSDLDIKRMA